MALSDFVKEYFKICCENNWDEARILQCWPARNRPAGNLPARNRPAGNLPARNRPAGNRPARNRPAGNRPARNRPAGNRPAGNLPTALQETWFGENAVLGGTFDNISQTVPGGRQYKKYYFPIGETADKNSCGTFRFLYSQSLYKKNKPYVFFSDDHYESYFILKKDGQNYPTAEFKVSSSPIARQSGDLWRLKPPVVEKTTDVTAKNKYFTTSPFTNDENKELKPQIPETITKYDKLTSRDAKCYYWPENSNVLLEYTKL